MTPMARAAAPHAYHCAGKHGKLPAMRVLHIGKFWPPYAGGIEQASHDLCVALAGAGVEVDVLAHATPRRWRASQHLQRGVRVHLAGCLGQCAYAPVSPGFPRRMAHLIATRKPQIVHLHMPNPAAFWALTLPAARRLPWVVHWHSDIPLVHAPGAVRALYPAYRRFEAALLHRAAAVVATSPDYRDSSAALQPWLAKTRVIALGAGHPPTVADAARDAALGLWPGAGLRLLGVGRLSHYKGFDVLLRALAQVPEVQLLLIGAGECGARLRRQVDALELGARVHLAGALDDAQRDAAYAAAELFCLPSVARSEAFGVVLLEAMRAGVPVLASKVHGSGMLHVLDHGRAGALVPPGDAAALAAALRGLAADPVRRRELAQAGLRRWQQHFTLAGRAAEVSRLYRDLLATPAADH